VSAAPEWEAPPQPDPRPAIVRLQRDLAARGIRLIVMPVPPKPTVHPEKLSGHYGGTSVVPQNPSFPVLVADLRRDGVLVFDATETLRQERADGSRYLATDTHWRPEAMESVAARLADMIGGAGRSASAKDAGYQVERVETQNVGDAARMLDLPAPSMLYPAETVWLRRILHADGSFWRPSRVSDVLLLGDSFTNIYSLESMGWGTSAGFAEQLSYALGRSIDRLVQNDEGAFATRAMLQRDPGRLDGKRVVVYEFAARELAFGDWKLLPLPAP
jgi:alginate O-acetyltransferase complex protein AlgJ